MTRDELIAALQKCPDNHEVVIDDPEYGLATVIDIIGVPRQGVWPDMNNKIVINLIGGEYIFDTASHSA